MDELLTSVLQNCKHSPSFDAVSAKFLQISVHGLFPEELLWNILFVQNAGNIIQIPEQRIEGDDEQKRGQRTAHFDAPCDPNKLSKTLPCADMHIHPLE